MNKYFEGSIFTNNYIEGAAGILASQMGGSLYARYGMKRSFIFSFGLSLLGGMGSHFLAREPYGIDPYLHIAKLPWTNQESEGDGT